MAWTPRESSHNLDGIACFDSLAGPPAPYSVTTTWPGTCNVINLYIMAAFKAAGTVAFVQGASTSSPDERPGGISSYDLSFAGPNAAGNLLIAAVAFSTGFSTAACTMTDSAGNTWILVDGSAVSSGGGARFGMFVCANCNASAGNIVTFTPVGVGGVFLDITAAVFEYSGMDTTAPTFYPFPPGSPSGANPLQWGGVGAPYVSPTGVCDAITQNSGPDVNNFTDSLTTTAAGDLLLLMTANLPYCGGVVVTGGGSPPGGGNAFDGSFVGIVQPNKVGGGTK